MSHRIFLVGNSHTYYNDMPEMIGPLLAAAGESKTQIQSSTAGGVSLRWHWNHRRTRQAVERQAWDWLVLQERSGGPLEKPDETIAYAERFSRVAIDHGANVCLYMTWAQRDQPQTQRIISRFYEDLADRLGAMLAPVGVIWERVLSDDPSVDLYDPDGRHASQAGSYLAACTLVSTITQKRPSNWPSVDGLGMKAAFRIQKAVTKEFNSKNPPLGHEG